MKREAKQRLYRSVKAHPEFFFGSMGGSRELRPSARHSFDRWFESAWSSVKQDAIFVRKIPYIVREFAMLPSPPRTGVFEVAEAVPLLVEGRALVHHLYTPVNSTAMHLLYLLDGTRTVEDVAKAFEDGEYDYQSVEYEGLPRSRIAWVVKYFVLRMLASQQVARHRDQERGPWPIYYPPGIKRLLQTEQPRLDRYYSPGILHLHTTWKCDLKCFMCYSKDRRYPQSHDLDTEAVKKIMRAFALSGGYQVILTGGEPLMREDLVEIITFVRELDGWGRPMGPRIYLTTNGIRFDKEIARSLQEFSLDVYRNGISPLSTVQFSLDGANASRHDWIRGRKGAWSSTMEAIKLARKHSLPVVVKTTFNRRTLGYHHVVAHFGLMERIDVNISCNLGFHPMGRVQDIHLYQPPFVTLLNLVRWLKTGKLDRLERNRLWRLSGFQTSFVPDQIRQLMKAAELRGVDLRGLTNEDTVKLMPGSGARIGCDEASGYDMVVSHTGNLMYCCFSNLSFENVRHRDAVRVWRASEDLGRVVSACHSWDTLCRGSFCYRCMSCSLRCPADRIEMWNSDWQWAIAHSDILCPAFAVALQLGVLEQEEKEAVPPQVVRLYEEVYFKELSKMISRREYSDILSLVAEGRIRLASE